MDIADTGDDHFLRLGIGAEGEGRVFLVELRQAGSDLVLLALRLGINRHPVVGRVVLHGLDGDRLTSQAQGVAGTDGGELRKDADVAAADLAGLGVVLALGEEHVAQLFVIAGAGVDDGQRILHVAGDDFEVGVFAVLIGKGIEHEGHGAAGRVELDFGLVAVVVDGDHGLALGGVRGVLNDIFDELDGTQARCGAAAEDRRDAALLQTGLDALAQLFFGEGLFHEEFLHELFVRLRDLLVDAHHVLFNLLFRVSRQGNLFAAGVIRLLGQHVDNADGLFAMENGEGQGNDAGAEGIPQGVEDSKIVGVLFIQLGDIEHCGKARVCQGFPALFRADNDAGLGAQADQAGIRNTQRLHHFRGEVKVTGVIQHVDLGALVLDRDDRGLDGVLSLLLFVIEVGDCGTVSALAETGDRLGVEQHALAQSRLAVAAMTQQGNITNVLGSVHKLFLLSRGSAPYHTYKAADMPQQNYYI